MVFVMYKVLSYTLVYVENNICTLKVLIAYACLICMSYHNLIYVFKCITS